MRIEAGDDSYFSVDGQPYQRGDYVFRFVTNTDGTYKAGLFDKVEGVLTFGFTNIERWNDGAGTSFTTPTQLLQSVKAFFFKQVTGGGGGTGAVESVFARTGIVEAQIGDYTTAQVTESTNKNYATDAELTKLAGLESSKFIGQYVSKSALDIAHPTAIIGSYAYVDQGVGLDVVSYIWDNDDVAWILQLGESTVETPASVKTKYETNANTNAFTDTEKTNLSNQSNTNTGDETEATIQAKRPLKTVGGTSLEGSGDIPITVPIQSVFSRTGVVTAQAGDYNASQVTNDSNVAGVNTDDAFNTLKNAKVDSTGLFTGGVISTGTGANQYSITDGTGQVVTSAGIKTDVSWTGKVDIVPANIGTTLRSYIGINSAGNVVEQPNEFTRAQSRSIVVLGIVVHPDNVNIFVVNNNQHIAYNVMSTSYDLAEAIGIFNISGNVYSGNIGGNLSLDKTVGTVFRAGSNYETDINDPHSKILPLLSVLNFNYVYNDNSNDGITTQIDPENLDDGTGGLIELTDLSKKWSVQRIYSFSSNTIAIQRGTEQYDNLDKALAGISTEDYFTASSIAPNGLLRGWMAVKGNAIDLTDPAQAQFIEAPKFGEGSGSTGGGGSVTDLQTAYNNSITPEIVTDASNGALTVKRGSALDTDNVFEGKNGAGTTTFGVDGNGNVGAISYNGVALTSLGLDDLFLNESGTYTNPFTAGATKYTETLLAVNWILDVGTVYYQDVTHGLNSEDVIISTYNPTTKETVIVEAIDRIGVNTIRIKIEGNTDDVRVVVFDSNLGIIQQVNKVAVTDPTTPYVPVNGDVVIWDCTAENKVLNLPQASLSPSYEVNVKKIDATANILTVNPNGVETIDGDTSLILNTQNESVTIFSNGVNWFII